MNELAVIHETANYIDICLQSVKNMKLRQQTIHIRCEQQYTPRKVQASKRSFPGVLFRVPNKCIQALIRALDTILLWVLAYTTKLQRLLAMFCCRHWQMLSGLDTALADIAQFLLRRWHCLGWDRTAQRRQNIRSDPEL